VAGLYPQYSKYLINERKDQLPIKGILTGVDETMEMEQKWRAYQTKQREGTKGTPPGYRYRYGWGYPGMPMPAYGQPAPMHPGWGQTAQP
jgi:hypothetical protein